MDQDNRRWKEGETDRDGGLVSANPSRRHTKISQFLTTFRIFATFPLQEVAVLAHRADESDSLARTVALTTKLQVKTEVDDPSEEDARLTDRALIM